MTFQQPNYTYHKVCAGLMKMIMHKNEEIEAIQEKFGMKIKRNFVFHIFLKIHQKWKRNVPSKMKL